MLIEESQEGQSMCTCFTRDSSCVGSDIRIDSWKMNMQRNVTYQLCIDRLNMEGSRDSASWLMHGDPHRLFS